MIAQKSTANNAAMNSMHRRQLGNIDAETIDAETLDLFL